MRRDRLHAQLHERGGGHRHHDQVVGRGGNAAAHQDANDARHDQRGHQRQRLRVRDGFGDHHRCHARDRLRRRDHDVRHLEAHAGQRDHADDDAHGAGRRAHGQRVLGAGFEGFVQVAHAQALIRIQQAHQDAARNARERRQIRRAAAGQHADQQDQRDQGGPTHLDRLLQLRHFFGRQAAQPFTLGLEVHLHEQAEEVQEGREDAGNRNLLVRNAQELDHQERGRAHDGGRDLSARAAGRFDARREMPGVADADHGGNGQRPDRDRVGHR
ncbi:hypothetical protein D3C85_1040510 [compost metagenome]